MKLLILLLVLGLRRVDASWPEVLARPDRHRHWLDSMARYLGNGPLLWLLAVLLPAVVVGLVVCWLAGFWGQLVVLIVGTALLLWLCGAQSEFRQVDELLVRGRMNDSPGFAAHASEEFAQQGTPGEGAYHRDLAEHILERQTRLFVVIFWLLVGGLAGVTLAVLHRAWMARTEQPAKWQCYLDVALRWPAFRLLWLSMALAGDFTAVMNNLKGHWRDSGDDYGLLRSTAEAACGQWPPGEPAGLPAAMDHLEALQGLMLRCVALWLILVALWVMLV